MEDKPLTGPLLYLLTLCLCLGTFIQILDTTISVVAIPYIAGGLAVSPNQGSWVITSFAVSNAVMLPLTGWLAKQVGEVKLFALSTALFSITSFMCGMAWSLSALILFRIAQGAVAGSLIPLSQSLLIKIYPEDKRGAAIGVWSMVLVVAPVVGPIVGGYLTEYYGWPWIFYINVPIGLFASFVVWHFLKERESATEKHPMDYLGFLFLVVGVACLQVVMDRGQQDDWLRSPMILSLTIASVIGIIFFIVWNKYSPDPIIDFTFFSDRNFTISTIASFTGFLFVFGSVVITPLWLQTSMGYTSLWSGIAIAPIGVIPIFLSSYVGRHMHKVDLRLLTTIAYVVFSATFFWASRFNTEVDIFHIMAPRFVQGFAITLYIIPLLSLALINIPKATVTSATGVYMFIRMFIGSGIGTSLFVTFYTRRQIFHHSVLTESVTYANPQTDLFHNILNSIELTGLHADALMNEIVNKQAAMLAINDLLWISGWGYIVIIPILWLCKGKSEAVKT